MRRFLITSLISITIMSGQLYAQQESPASVDQKVYDTDLRKLRESITALKAVDDGQKKVIEDIDKKVSEIQKRIAENDAAIQKKVTDVSQNANEAQSRITGLGEQLGQRTFQLSLGTVLAGVLGVAGLFLAFVVRKRYADGSATLETRLSQMREQLDNEAVILDGKLLDVLQNQIKLLQAEREKTGVVPAVEAVPIQQSVDHSLPLKVGEEIFRMRQRLSALPDDTKGLKPLQKSLERLEEEFNQSGYEMINMLGLKYDEGMSVKAKFIASDELENGQAVITKVVKPQINFKAVSIQDAEIEVSIGG